MNDRDDPTAPLAFARARQDLDLECPPTAIPVGDAIRRLRRRSRLIDWLLTVLIVATPLAIVGGGVALLLLRSTTADIDRRADAVVRSNADVVASNTELVERLDQLERTNANLEELVTSFRALALATTSEERQAAREAIAGAARPDPQPGPPPPEAEPPTSTTSAAPTTTTPPPPTSTTTTAPARPTCSTVPLLGCIPLTERTTR